MTEHKSKYMVIDLGGGTADITVLEKLANSQLKELRRATGNECEGTSVDDRFFHLLEEIFGGPFMKMTKDDDPSVYLDLFREFETVKRTITPTKESKVNISIPYTSLDSKCKKILGKHLHEIIGSSAYSKQIEVRGDKIRIDASLMKSLFQPTVDSIILLIQNIMQDKAASGVSQLLLVGGFSECLLIQDAIRRNFARMTIIIPEEADLSFLKGAVLFGHRTEYVRSRVMRFSYGLETCTYFDPEIHNRKYLNDNQTPYICEKIFQMIVEKDQEVELGQTFKRNYQSDPMQKALGFRMYTSADNSPIYVDESSCTFLGSANIIFLTPMEDKRELNAKNIFGNTEIGMTVVDETTGTTITASFDLI